jgi:hypothetical protein
MAAKSTQERRRVRKQELSFRRQTVGKEETMKETEFQREVESRLQQSLPKYQVRSGVNLQHSVIFDGGGEVWPPGVRALRPEKRYAYQADIVVIDRDGKVPLVAVELKCGQRSGYTTHDVLTYSAKAARHKELYPYLRYGMAVGSALPIGRKFFFNNRALDFVVGVGVADENGFRRLVEVVEHQVRLAEDGLKILDRKAAPRVLSWQAGMRWDWASRGSDTEGDEEE